MNSLLVRCSFAILLIILLFHSNTATRNNVETVHPLFYNESNVGGIAFDNGTSAPAESPVDNQIGEEAPSPSHTRSTNSSPETPEPKFAFF